MADEPRRSGRATKGQHKNASSSPAPQPKPTKKSRPAKKGNEPEPKQDDEEDDEEEVIRCICGNNDPSDKRPFISCDACQVWQHNVCMGMPDDDDDLPDHYLCEECSPEEHQETLQALERGEQIWETRNRIYNSEKKMSKKRKGETAKMGWLKKDLSTEDAGEEQAQEEGSVEQQETGSKRKREEVKEELPSETADEKPTRSSRQDKRRKSAIDSADPETALVEIDKLPNDRQKIAVALSKIIAEDVQGRVKISAFRVPDGHTPKSLGDHHASRIEYALKMNYEGPSNQQYGQQFRIINANLKKNRVLVTRLVDESLTADELSTMTSNDMASEELQKERAEMKEQLDRQAVAVQVEGPRYRGTHKGLEMIEDENAQIASQTQSAPQPVRERTSVGEDGAAGSPTGEAGSPMQTDQPLRVETRGKPNAGLPERRTSSQQFDMNNIWAKTAQSPTSASGTRPMQMPPKRRSSVQHHSDGTKDDADVDRLLQDDDDETYSPADYTDPEGVVWRGQLVQSADSVSPTVNARFVAGRDITPTVAWRDLLPDRLSIDGRLQVEKAEEYLCSLQWSQNSDVSVLALTPYDDAEGFETLFQYFKTRSRYAVVNKDKPTMVKDLYIIPVDANQELPTHVGMLEYCRFSGNKAPEKCLLASFVVGRAVGTPEGAATATPNTSNTIPGGSNGQQHLPQHVRSAPGPAGSPLNASTGTFSPQQTQPPPGTPGGIPTNPYNQTPSHPNPLVNQILGSLQYAPSAQAVVQSEPNIDQAKLENLRKILEENPAARTDLHALSRHLAVRPQ